MEFAVVVVFDDRRAHSVCESQQFLSSANRHQPTGWVLMGWSDKNESRTIAPPLERQPAAVKSNTANGSSRGFKSCARSTVAGAATLDRSFPRETRSQTGS